MTENIIKISGITRQYILGKTVIDALRGIDLEIVKGEFTVVLGPSGSGKSTLLNIIGCLDRATSGSYILDGEEIAGRDFNSLSEIRNRKIGFIFQSFNLIPVLNVMENIEFPCLLRKDRDPNLRENVLKICEEVGLSSFVHHKPDELSGGQRQRVAIARALITSPSIVLADEPTANLDSKTSDQILDLMVNLNKNHQVTFIFATHDPRVMDRARRTLRIKDGKMETNY
ncbi:MAG: ABC transporter ATP-binding protein [Pseudomonadota bacterium]